MENKKLVSSGNATVSLIINYLLWGIPIGIISGFIINILRASTGKNMSSIVLFAIALIIITGLSINLMWTFSTSSTFKKKTIYSSDAKKVMRNLLIFVIVCCIITGANNYYKGYSTIYEQKYKLEKLKSENESDQGYSAKYEIQQLEESIEKSIKLTNTMFGISEIIVIATNILALQIEKKRIMKYVS